MKNMLIGIITAVTFISNTIAAEMPSYCKDHQSSYIYFERSDSAVYISSEEDLIDYVKNQLMKREQNIEASYVSEKKLDMEYFDSVVTKACEQANGAFGGDYLYHQSRERSMFFTESEEDEKWIYNINYTISYYITHEQEKFVDEKTDEILSSLELENKSEYEKIRIIYEYICANVSYDYDNLNDDSYKLKHTAYAALSDGECVCDGYASLLYCLLIKAGIDCRIITGNAGCFLWGFENYEYHAWNIVKLDGKYYNLDATWDAGEKYFNYFLLSDETFSDNPSKSHKRDDVFSSQEFYESYPMAEEDNPYAETLSGDCGKLGDNLTWMFSNGTLTISGIGDMNHYYLGETPWYDFRNIIKSVNIEHGVTSLSNFAFYSCINLQRVSLPDTLKTMEGDCFSNCQSLAEITIPDSVTSIGDSSFSCCYNLKSVKLSQSISELPDFLFSGCESLSSVEIPEGVTRIGHYALSAQGLKSVTIPDTVTIIDTLAFDGSDLGEIYIPDTVVQIGGGAFSGGNIEKISVSDDNLYFSVIDGVLL